MSLPLRSTAYPPQMSLAISRAISEGALTIPCENPAALRLQFNGLRGALRKEKAAKEIDMVAFLIRDNPPRLIIEPRFSNAFAKEIEAALIGENSPPLDSSLQNPIDEAESALARILNSTGEPKDVKFF